MGQFPITTPTGYNNANDTVEQKFTKSQTYADNSFTAADTAIKALQSFMGTVEEISTTVNMALSLADLSPSTDVSSYLQDAPDNPITTADFTAIDNATPTSTLFSYSEDVPASFTGLMGDLQGHLTSILDDNGQGLLGASVENALINRETERDLLINQDAMQKVSAEWSKRRIPYPSGGFFNALTQVNTEYQNKRLDKSREIEVEARKIEIDVLKTTLSETNQLLGKIMDYNNKYWDRKLQAAKATVDIALEILKATIEKLKAKAEIYATDVQGFAAYMNAVTHVADSEIAAIKAKVEFAVGEGNIKIEGIKANIQQHVAEYQTSAELAKAVAQVTSQLAASAMAAVSASAQISHAVSTQAYGGSVATETWEHKLSS